MSDPICHHYNPQFYLRQWAGADGRLIRFYRPYRRVVASPISPEYTGFEERLYTLEGAADPQIVETGFFSPVDNAAALVLEQLVLLGPRLVAVRGLDNKQRSDWTRFLLSLVTRSPRSLEEFKQALNKIIRDNIEQGHNDAYLANKRAGDPQSVYEYALQRTPALENVHKAFLPELVDQKELGQFIINMIWAVFDVSEAPFTLLTADRPCMSHHGGLLHPACLLTLPLSPIHLFVAANDIHQLRNLETQRLRDTVQKANTLIIKNAVLNVYGKNVSHLAFVEQHLRLPTDPIVPGVMAMG
jgi:uncharacterized protein DUF4238